MPADVETEIEVVAPLLRATVEGLNVQTTPVGKMPEQLNCTPLPDSASDVDKLMDVVTAPPALTEGSGEAAAI